MVKLSTCQVAGGVDDPCQTSSELLQHHPFTDTVHLVHCRRLLHSSNEASTRSFNDVCRHQRVGRPSTDRTIITYSSTLRTKHRSIIKWLDLYQTVHIQSHSTVCSHLKTTCSLIDLTIVKFILFYELILIMYLF